MTQLLCVEISRDGLRKTWNPLQCRLAKYVQLEIQQRTGPRENPIAIRGQANHDYWPAMKIQKKSF